LHHLRAGLLQQAFQFRPLFPGARNDDSFPEQRLRFEPVELLAKQDDIAHHDERRRVRSGGSLLNVLQRSGHRPLLRSGGLGNDGHRSPRRGAVLTQLSHDQRQIAGAHQEDDGS
jgi:hypothetical protein